MKKNEGNMFYWGRRGPSVHLGYPMPRDTKILVYPWRAEVTYRLLNSAKPDRQGNSIYTAWFGEADSIRPSMPGL